MAYSCFTFDEDRFEVKIENGSWTAIDKKTGYKFGCYREYEWLAEAIWKYE